jgi:hypothetical protein
MPLQIGLNASVGASGDSSESNSSGGIRTTLTLSDIDEPVTIKKPDNVVTDSSAIQALGGMLGGLGGGQ